MIKVAWDVEELVALITVKVMVKLPIKLKKS